MPAEIITTTDWISAIAAALACIATFILAVIAWRQSSIADQQRVLLKEQAEIFRRQTGYQGQQTTISKQQAAVMVKQADISHQQLDIIKDQEADRKNIARRADLVLTPEAVGDKLLDLILENKGGGWAREIKIYINGYLIEEEHHPDIWRLLPGSAAQTEIGPGNKLDYLLEFPSTPAPTNLRVDFSWISENGVRGTNLAFIVPRQQFEVYKQEHQVRQKITDKEPRMEAYRKFMDVMSMSPINVHYAQFRIVPQLETIQLYASQDVKKIAGEIYDWAKAEMKKNGKIPHLPLFVDRVNNELKPIIQKEIEDLQVDR